MSILASPRTKNTHRHSQKQRHPLLSTAWEYMSRVFCCVGLVVMILGFLTFMHHCHHGHIRSMTIAGGCLMAGGRCDHWVFFFFQATLRTIMVILVHFLISAIMKVGVMIAHFGGSACSWLKMIILLDGCALTPNTFIFGTSEIKMHTCHHNRT